MRGTIVETTIRVVSRRLKDGLLEDAGGRLLLKEPERLTALAEGAEG